MVKELNNMKNKKSNNYKPYDSSNSFVRRVTSRVSQLLPQPTSWLSRFLSRPPEDAEPIDTQEADDEETVQPPPSKRMRTVQTCTEFPLYHNSVGSLDNRRLEDRREEELSPIRSYKLPVSGPSRSDDLDAPGPSGLNRHRFIVASTPAVPLSGVPEQIQPKVNGDDGSDSDSVSHASSQPPESLDQDPKSLFRTLNKPRQNRLNVPGEHNNLLRSKQMKLDLSSSSLSSSRGRVSFDTTVFNSPFKGRLCGGLSMSRDDSIESPFYRSSTTYGGASSCNDSMLRTRSLHSEVPIVVQPSQPQRVSDNLGSSTRKILKALEQFSTPMLDQTRRSQARDRGIKRKVEVPYKELVIPQMPDLLRIKRRDARHARQFASASNSTASVENADLSCKPATMPSLEATASTSSTPELSQRLCKFEDISKDKMECASDKKAENSKKMKESPSVMTGLPLTTLPKFDTGLVKPPLPTSSCSATKPASIQFKFSKPISISHNAVGLSSIPLSKKFSEPLDPEAKESNSLNESKSISNCMTSKESKGIKESMNYSPPSNTKLKRKESAKVNKAKVSISSELKSGSVMDVLNKSAIHPTSQLKSGSVMDALKTMQDSKEKSTRPAKWECQGCYVSNDEAKTKCVACEQPRKVEQTSVDSSKGFGDKFKMSSNQWECSCCCVRNKISESKCVACGEAKPGVKAVKDSSAESSKPPLLSTGFGDKFKPPAGSWECSVCLVQNKSGDTKCVSCSSDKPGASTQPNSMKTTAPPLSSLFKKPEGSWECDTCLVRNKNEVTSCVACGTDRPGHKSAQPAISNSTFSFGIPNASDTDTKYTFGISTTTASESSVKTTSVFTSSVPSTQTPTFSFGIPSTVESKSANAATPNSVFSNVKSTNIEKKNSDVNESSEAEVSKSSSNVAAKKSDPSFVFSVPTTKGVSSPQGSKSIFGNVVTTSVTSSSTTTSFAMSSTSTTSATPASLPIFVNQISSTKSFFSPPEKSTAAPTNPIFTFGSSNSSVTSQKETPSEITKPLISSTPVFATGETEVKPMTTSPVTSNATFPTVNSDMMSSETKPNLFTFSNKGTVDKKPFQNSNNVSEPSAFSSVAVTSFSTPSSSNTIKPVFSFTGGFGAGSGSEQKPNTMINSFSSQPAQQSSGGFNFKPSEPNFTFTEKKSEPSSTPFQFTTSNNHTNSFGTSAPAANQFNSGFGNATNSPFSPQGSIFGSSAPQPVQTASFLFGASQANDRPPAAPTFNFTAQSGASTGNSVGNTAVAGGFAFGQTQNSTPVQPPAFDPNIKPIFNFSGGQTPTFSAPSTTAVGTERKIRRAVRRTTQK